MGVSVNENPMFNGCLESNDLILIVEIVFYLDFGWQKLKDRTFLKSNSILTYVHEVLKQIKTCVEKSKLDF